MSTKTAWGVEKAGTKNFTAFKIARPKVGDFPVKMEMLYCGVCHTDVLLALNMLGNSILPNVPVHELVGKVVEIGPKVTKFKLGDHVGASYIFETCNKCPTCSQQL